MFMRKLLHIGIPANEKRPDMTYVPGMKLSITNPDASAHKIEWLHFDFDCPMPKLLQESTHIAYQVENLDEELKGANILVPPSPLGDNMRLAFVVEEGIPVELIEVKA